MNLLQLLPIGDVDHSLLQGLQVAIPQRLCVKCEIAAAIFDPEPAFHTERQQYHSSEILQRMQLSAGSQWRLLGIANVDLYIPILKYVFGEAQMGGPCAVISAYRLRQEFYGLEANDELLSQRLLKESVHELGHTLNLRHCEDYRCVMASSHAVEWIDLRESAMCDVCRAQAESNAKIGARMTSSVR